MMQRVNLVVALSLTSLSMHLYGANSLNAGYAKLSALSATQDISASTLTSDNLRYAKYSLPYRFDELYQYADYMFSLQLRANYLSVKSSSIYIGPENILQPRWDILNITAAPQVTYNINDNFTIEGELELGYANLNNQSSFRGEAQMKDALSRDGLLGWNSHTLHLTPKIGVINTHILDNQQEITVHSHLAYMLMKGVKNEKKLNINSSTGIWSAGGEYKIPDMFRVNNRPFSLIIANDIGGFYGHDYRELSFGFINTTSLAVEVPVNFYGDDLNIKLGIGYLSSDKAQGYTILFEIR